MGSNANKFSKANRDRVKVGEEICVDGLVWKKLSGGTGVWKYDFTKRGKRYKGTIGKERDGVLSTTVKEFLRKKKAKAELCSNPVLFEKHNPTFKQTADEFLEYSEPQYKDHRHNESRYRNHLITRV